MAIFRDFRRLTGDITGIHSTLTALVAIQRDLVPALHRLDALEHARHSFEAQVESMVLKAEGKLRAAANSEARERQLKKSNEKLVDGYIADSGSEAPEGGDSVLPDDVKTGEEKRLRPVHLGLAPTGKTLAVRAKFGL